MKKIFSFIVLLFFVFGIGGDVFAEEDKCEYEIVSEKYFKYLPNSNISKLPSFSKINI